MNLNDVGVIATVIATVIAVTTFVTQKIASRKRKQELKMKSFLVRPGKINENFYSHFSKVIKNAKESIYITGRGLPMNTHENRSIATKYIRLFEDALEANGKLQVVRIQFTEGADCDWFKELKQLKFKSESFSKRFHVCVLEESLNHDMIHVASIDADAGAENCIVELMIPVKKNDGIDKKEVAGSAIFIEGNVDLAWSMEARIIELKDKCKCLNSPEDFDPYI